MRAAFAATLGALLMAAVADPTPAQDEKKEPELKAPYTERVTYRIWSIADQKFLARPTRVDAYRKEVDGVQTFYLKRAGIVGGLPSVGSEIIDKDEVTWVITKSEPANAYICRVVRKSPPAKTKATKKQ